MERVRALRGLLPQSLIVYYKQPLLINKGLGQYLFDCNGKKYLDLFGGIVTVSVGHCHPAVNAALKQQLDRLWHTTSIYLTSPGLEYAQRLTDTLPNHLKVCFFVNSGSEANDLALQLARLHTGRFDLLTLRNGYHGLTQTVQGATNLGNWKQPLPAGFGILKTTNADPYRGNWGGSHCRDSPCQVRNRSCNCGDGNGSDGDASKCKATDAYINELDQALLYDFPAATGPAALLIESIQGVGGTVQYPRGFLRRAFEAVQSRGGVAIADEVQTGFGRLGSHFWGFESQGARPDLVTMAKGMGNGFPMGAVVTTKEIADSINKGLYFNTFGGNPLAATVGLAVLDVIRDEKLQENSAIVGEYFLKQLASIDSPLIGDVRGKGLMIGVELVDPETGNELGKDRMADIFEAIKDRGVLSGKGGLKGNVLRIKPPMCINKKDVDQAVTVIADVLKQFR